MSTRRHVRSRSSRRGILTVWVDIFRHTNGAAESPIMSDKQVGNLVFPRYKKNRESQGGVLMKTASPPALFSCNFTITLSASLYIGHFQPHRECLLLHIVPRCSAKCLEWAARVSCHITLQLHHIPSVYLATRCPRKKKQWPTWPQCRYVTLRLSLSARGSEMQSCEITIFFSRCSGCFGTVEPGSTGAVGGVRALFVRAAEFGERWGSLPW